MLGAEGDPVMAVDIAMTVKMVELTEDLRQYQDGERLSLHRNRLPSIQTRRSLKTVDFSIDYQTHGSCGFRGQRHGVDGTSWMH